MHHVRQYEEQERQPRRQLSIHHTWVTPWIRFLCRAQVHPCIFEKVGNDFRTQQFNEWSQWASAGQQHRKATMESPILQH
eukprot:3977552-Amphidinium_carterae.1